MAKMVVNCMEELKMSKIDLFNYDDVKEDRKRQKRRKKRKSIKEAKNKKRKQKYIIKGD